MYNTWQAWNQNTGYQGMQQQVPYPQQYQSGYNWQWPAQSQYGQQATAQYSQQAYTANQQSYYGNVTPNNGQTAGTTGVNPAPPVEDSQYKPPEPIESNNAAITTAPSSESKMFATTDPTELERLNQLQQQAQQWQQHTRQWQEYQQNLVQSWQQSQQQQMMMMQQMQNWMRPEMQGVAMTDKEEEEFELQWTTWLEQFKQWKEENKNHPNKEVFQQYEEQWLQWQQQMEQRREQVKKYRQQNQLKVETKLSVEQTLIGSAPPPPPPSQPPLQVKSSDLSSNPSLSLMDKQKTADSLNSGLGLQPEQQQLSQQSQPEIQMMGYPQDYMSQMSSDLLKSEMSKKFSTLFSQPPPGHPTHLMPPPNQMPPTHLPPVQPPQNLSAVSHMPPSHPPPGMFPGHLLPTQPPPSLAQAPLLNRPPQTQPPNQNTSRIGYGDPFSQGKTGYQDNNRNFKPDVQKDGFERENLASNQGTDKSASVLTGFQRPSQPFGTRYSEDRDEGTRFGMSRFTSVEKTKKFQSRFDEPQKLNTFPMEDLVREYDEKDSKNDFNDDDFEDYGNSFNSKNSFNKRNQFGGSNEGFGSRTQFGNSREPFGSYKDESFGSSREQFSGGRNSSFSAKNQFGDIGGNKQMSSSEYARETPSGNRGFRDQIGGLNDSKDQFSSSRDQFGGLGNQFNNKRSLLGDPNDQLGIARNQLGDSRDQYGNSRDQINDTKDQFGNSRDQYGGPRNAFVGTRDQFDSKNQFGNNKDQFGGSRDQFSGQREQFGGPRDQFGNSRDQFGGPDQFSGPREQFNGPRDQFNNSKDQFSGPRDQFEGPRDQFGSSKDQFGGPRNQFGGPRDQFSGAREQFNGPRDQFSGPRDQFSGPRDQFSGPRDQFSGPRDQFSGPKDQFSGPRDQFSGPRDQLPRDQFSGQRDQFSGPRDQFSGPRDQFSGPRDQTPGQRDQFSGVREQFHSGPKDAYGGPRDQFSGLKDSFSGPNDKFDISKDQFGGNRNSFNTSKEPADAQREQYGGQRDQGYGFKDQDPPRDQLPSIKGQFSGPREQTSRFSGLNNFDSSGKDEMARGEPIGNNKLVVPGAGNEFSGSENISTVKDLGCKDTLGSSRDQSGGPREAGSIARDRRGESRDALGSRDQRGGSRDTRGRSRDQRGGSKDRRGGSRDRRGGSRDRRGPRGGSRDRRGSSRDGRFGSRESRFGSRDGRSRDRLGASRDRRGRSRERRGGSRDRRGSRDRNAGSKDTSIATKDQSKTQDNSLKVGLDQLQNSLKSSLDNSLNTAKLLSEAPSTDALKSALDAAKPFLENSKNLEISKPLLETPKSLMDLPKPLLTPKPLLDTPTAFIDSSKPLLETPKSLFDSPKFNDISNSVTDATKSVANTPKPLMDSKPRFTKWSGEQRPSRFDNPPDRQKFSLESITNNSGPSNEKSKWSQNHKVDNLKSLEKESDSSDKKADTKMSPEIKKDESVDDKKKDSKDNKKDSKPISDQQKLEQKGSNETAPEKRSEKCVESGESSSEPLSKRRKQDEPKTHDCLNKSEDRRQEGTSEKNLSGSNKSWNQEQLSHSWQRKSSPHDQKPQSKPWQQKQWDSQPKTWQQDQPGYRNVDYKEPPRDWEKERRDQSMESSSWQQQQEQNWNRGRDFGQQKPWQQKRQESFGKPWQAGDKNMKPWEMQDDSHLKPWQKQRHSPAPWQKWQPGDDDMSGRTGRDSFDNGRGDMNFSPNRSQPLCQNFNGFEEESFSYKEYNSSTRELWDRREKHEYDDWEEGSFRRQLPHETELSFETDFGAERRRFEYSEDTERYPLATPFVSSSLPNRIREDDRIFDERNREPVARIEYGHRPAREFDGFSRYPSTTSAVSALSHTQKVEAIDYGHGQHAPLSTELEVTDFMREKEKLNDPVPSSRDRGLYDYERAGRFFDYNLSSREGRESLDRDRFRENLDKDRPDNRNDRRLRDSDVRNENERNPSKFVRSEPKIETVLVEDLLNYPGRASRPTRIVVIIRGPPGSGKTFVAKLIKDKEVDNGVNNPRMLCLDDYFMVEVEKTEKDPETGKRVKKKIMEYEFEAEMEVTYRASLFKTFKKTVEDGFFPFIIVDAINNKVRHFEEMWSFAKQKGFQVYVVEMTGDAASCSKRNTHNRSMSEISKIISSWEPTPKHYLRLDVRSLLQDAAIPEVEMEDFVEDTSKIKVDDIQPQEAKGMEPIEGVVVKSRWEQFETSEERLDKLDGIRSHKGKLEPSVKRLEDYLQLPDDYEYRQSKPGQKRVRWADIEERKDQEKKRALGFVIGQTDWAKMTDDLHPERCLNQTKYI